jgi:hypothetical protein
MKINPQDVFKGLMRKEGEMERLVSALMNLPASPVWINERHIYTAISLPQGQAFGRFHALSCLISVIKKGYGGNKRKEGDPYFCVDSKYAGCSFNEQSGHKIAFQEYGAFESFHAGEFAEPVEGRPRWFCLGERVRCNLKTQLAIMAEAVGDESIDLDDDTRARRKAGFAAFFFEGRVDGGYSMVDVPQIAYNNYQELSSIFKKGVSSRLECISRDMFDTEELSEFEELLRHIIVGKVAGGKVLVSGDQWVLQKTNRVNNERVTTVRSLTPPPIRPPTQDHQEEPPPRKTRRHRHISVDNDDGLPFFLYRSKLSECML